MWESMLTQVQRRVSEAQALEQQPQRPHAVNRALRGAPMGLAGASLRSCCEDRPPLELPGARGPLRLEDGLSLFPVSKEWKHKVPCGPP